MSRSKKKNPYISTTCIGLRPGVMKDWKKSMNRKMRQAKTTEDGINPTPKQFGSSWTAPHDGKHYYDKPEGYRK